MSSNHLNSLVQMGKVIIFSAPSGSGKSTIVNYLLSLNLGLEFSISATSRVSSRSEKDGVEYYFLSTEEFERRIAADEFVEHEEVYKGCYYGTLRSEVERIWGKGHTIVFDVDVKGGLNLKRFLARRLSLFSYSRLQLRNFVADWLAVGRIAPRRLSSALPRLVRS